MDKFRLDFDLLEMPAPEFPEITVNLPDLDLPDLSPRQSRLIIKGANSLLRLDATLKRMGLTDDEREVRLSTTLKEIVDSIKGGSGSGK